MVFYTIIFLLFGLKELAKRDVDLSRFKTSIYQISKAHEAKNRKKSPVFVMSWDKATPIVLLGGITTGVAIYSVAGVVWIAVVSSLAGLLFPKLWLDYKVAAQKDDIDKGMEQATETIATVMRSGGGLAEAFERAAVDARMPLSGYLLETATQIRTGVSQAEAVGYFQQRVPLKELSIITVGMKLAAVGMPININEMFFEAQKNIRDRLAFNREIRVLVAENKISAWVVAVMPVFLLSFIRQMAPEMVEPLFTTTLGIVVFCFCTSFIAVGIYMIMQIVKPRV